ncbi:MAG: methyltransferase domain-containing protein [Actinobacteria bacterium]|uniref:Unannotated protein n=1 Tax=freshwater metagenome TaxID=449393 RepID=A0A6J6QCU6_9ZZZZ|nr:methyltransferase domain-containing protein [Actinomycetota bacterium]
MSVIEPDTKDWTWVLQRPCEECGFDAARVERSQIGALVRGNARTWVEVLRAPGATARTSATTWSVLEYACHVRDVHAVFGERLALMLREDDPAFANWDQDETAIEQDYAHDDPAAVTAALATAAEAVAAAFDAVPGDAWSRRGTRSNGSEFTVDSLARYLLHDLLHHAWDVRDAVSAITVAAYDSRALDYSLAASDVPPWLRDRVQQLRERLGEGARVLEIGSGGGRDARILEELGLVVRRTDITPAFAELLRAEGHAADLLDPLHDDLDDPRDPGAPYDAVWANACLLHVERMDLPRLLARLHAAVRPDGLLAATLKEGDGDLWSTHGTIDTPRRFVLWREEPLRAALHDAGWSVESVGHRIGIRDTPWLEVVARRS